MFPGLGSLTSLTGGGGLQASSSAESSARTGDVTVGGLTISQAGNNQLMIVGAVVLAAVFLLSRKR